MHLEKEVPIQESPKTSWHGEAVLSHVSTCLTKYLFTTIVCKFLPEKPVLWLNYGFDVLFYIMCNLISLSFVNMNKKLEFELSFETKFK